MGVEHQYIRGKEFNWTAVDRKNTQNDRAYIGLSWLSKGTVPVAGCFPYGNYS